MSVPLGKTSIKMKFNFLKGTGLLVPSFPTAEPLPVPHLSPVAGVRAHAALRGAVPPKTPSVLHTPREKRPARHFGEKTVRDTCRNGFPFPGYTLRLPFISHRHTGQYLAEKHPFLTIILPSNRIS